MRKAKIPHSDYLRIRMPIAFRDRIMEFAEKTGTNSSQLGRAALLLFMDGGPGAMTVEKKRALDRADPRWNPQKRRLEGVPRTRKPVKG